MIVIGGGICGLACAYQLKRAGVPVILLEQSARAGGVIDSTMAEGFTFDLGPQSFLSTPVLLELVRELGIENALQTAPPSAPRYILLGGKLHSAPMAPPSLVTSSLLSARTKFKLIGEPMGRSAPPAHDESMADFVRRKFGPDMLDNLVAPFVSGVYAGDAEKLSLRAAFPQIHEWERGFGSVIRGAMKSRDPNKPKSNLCAFRGGMRTLTAALESRLAGQVQVNARVESIRRTSESGTGRFEIGVLRDGQPQTLSAAAVVLTTPSYVTARLLSSVAPAAHEPLLRIEYAPVAVVNLGFRRSDVAHPLAGFGFLVSRREGSQILGTVFSSSLFPGRSPDGHVSLTTFAGGALNAGIVERDDASLATIVESELSSLLGISAPPVAVRIWRHPRAIPQYNVGHTDRITTARNAAEQVHGLFLAGNYFAGPAVGACVENGQAAAAQAAEFVKAG